MKATDSSTGRVLANNGEVAGSSPASVALTPDEKNLMKTVREAVRMESRGDPMKDIMDDWHIVEALKLLVKLEKASRKSVIPPS